MLIPKVNKKTLRVKFICIIRNCSDADYDAMINNCFRLLVTLMTSKMRYKIYQFRNKPVKLEFLLFYLHILFINIQLAIIILPYILRNRGFIILS